MTSERLLWLNDIIALYVSPSLRVVQCQDGHKICSRNDTGGAIYMACIPALWQTGCASDLTCGHITIPSQGKVLAAPGHTPGSSSCKELFEADESSKETNVQCAYDILGLAYFMLTRAEEINSDQRTLDPHQRFPATSSHAYRHNYLVDPIVDKWMKVLSQTARKIWPRLELTPHTYAMLLSHDVDEPSRYGFRTPLRGIHLALTHAWLNRSPKPLFVAWQSFWHTNIKKKISPSDPCNSFEFIMDTSEKNGLESAFYFICGTTNRTYDADYSATHPAIRHLMRNMHERGHEIGLHSSYNSFRSAESIAQEAKSLRTIIAEEKFDIPSIGGRMHYLRWETPTTMRACEKARLLYDTTLGYADHAGFRCGTCREYPAFDPVSEKRVDLKIRPLIAMETSVIDTQYMGLGTGKNALQMMVNLKNQCKDVGGNFTLLWHNSRLLKQEEKELFKKTIEG